MKKNDNKQVYRPPKIAGWILEKLVDESTRYTAMGDFEEQFILNAENKGILQALFVYWFQIIVTFPSFMFYSICWSFIMFKNYMKITLRNIRRYKTYSFINIMGLSVGIACCLLILLFVRDELSYDRYHEKGDRICRLVDSFEAPGGMDRHFAFSSAPIAPALKNDFPEVEDAVRLISRRRLGEYAGKKFYENYLFYADASLFSIFTFPLIRGNPETALEEPNSVVISQETALKYFGEEEPVNKTLKLDGNDFLVTGIMENMPKSSHFYANIFCSFKTLEQSEDFRENYLQSWARHEFYTYILMQENYDYRVLEAKLPGFIEKYAAQEIREILGGTMSSRLQPLRSIHLHSNLHFEIRTNGDIKYVYIFSIIAFFILLIACVNYMNLATARSANRAKEVGLRKVVGANRKQIIKQFLGESFLITVTALLLSLVLVVLALPFFNSLTGKQMEIADLITGTLLFSIMIILFFTGIISGSYPAFLLSHFKPVNVFKGAVSKGSKSSFLRKGLVVFQFSISIILIISTVVVLDQLDFLRNRKLGFNKEHVVVVPITTSSIRDNAETIKAELMQNPNIISSTISIGVPGGIVAGDAIRLVTEEGKKTFTVRMIYTDHDYIKTMGIEIVKGRDFSKDMKTDAQEAFIINEAAVRELQLIKPLETQFEWGGPQYGIEKKGKVIGVVKDFQFQSLKADISPLVIHINSGNAFVFAMRILPEDIPGTLKYIEDKWKELVPEHPFEYTFMDETFDKLYRSEEKLGKIFNYFSFLALLIAVAGLFGLASFVVEQRSKEIAVRKVLGASIISVFTLISKEFTKWVLIANIIAWPLAYIAMGRWLREFAYRVSVGFWIFILAGGLALLVAWLTVSYQTVRAALANPVDSLRNE